MSLETILTAIEAAGAAQLADLQRQTEAQIEEIRKTAELEAATQQAQAHQQAQLPITAESTRRLSQANLQARQLLATAQETIIQEVLTRTRSQLNRLRENPGYPAILRLLVIEAVQALGEDDFCLLAAANDKHLLDGILAELKLEAPVEFSPGGWGGVMAHSQDDCICVNNTLESRLEQAIPYIRHDLAAFLQTL